MVKSLGNSMNESVMFNQKDYYFDFDKFESGKENIVFVTGLTGSGKTTIGRELASKYSAVHVELDILENVHRNKNTLDELKVSINTTVLYDFLKNNKEIYESLMSDISNEEISHFNDKFIEYTISYAKKHKDKKFVVEGIQIYEYCTYYHKRLRPIVVKGTSVFVSFIRKIKREHWTLKEILREAPTTLKWLLESDKDISDLIKSIKDN